MAVIKSLLDEDKITQAEMVALFGERMPIEAAHLLLGVGAENETIGEIRSKLRKIAATHEMETRKNTVLVVRGICGDFDSQTMTVRIGKTAPIGGGRYYMVPEHLADRINFDGLPIAPLDKNTQASQ